MKDSILRIFILFFLAAGVSKASAHEAPTGWTYDYSCCSNQDCREVSTVKVTPEGYIVPSGELIPMGDSRIKDSKDEFYHWCTVAGLETSSTLCLYVPQNMF